MTGGRQSGGDGSSSHYTRIGIPIYITYRVKQVLYLYIILYTLFFPPTKRPRRASARVQVCVCVCVLRQYSILRRRRAYAQARRLLPECTSSPTGRRRNIRIHFALLLHFVFAVYPLRICVTISMRARACVCAYCIV